MFTGLVAATGSVRSITDARLTVECDIAQALSEGDSVCVNGVCLSATRVADGGFAADVMAETMRRTALGTLRSGDRVNVELPLRATDRLGGHLVQGHVDGTGAVELVAPEGSSLRMRIAAPAELLRYVVEKGSIAVDGVSLTVADVDDEALTVALIPETLARTTLGSAVAGQRVNLEVDLLAKYVEKLVSHSVEAS